MLSDQLPLSVDESALDSSQAPTTIGPLRSDASPNACPSQTQSLYHGGYNNTIGRCGTCLPDVHTEGLENGSHGICDGSSSLPFHGYGYAPQMPERPYPPFMMQLPSASHHGQLYNVREFPNADPAFYQQLLSPDMSYVASRTPTSQAKLPGCSDLQEDGNIFGPTLGYFPSLGSFGAGNNFSGNTGEFKLLQQGFGGIENGALWSDWSKPVNGKNSLVHLSSPATNPKPIGSNQFGMASQQKDSFYGFGSHSSSGYKSYSHGRSDQVSGYEDVSSSVFGINGQSWPTLDEARQAGRCNDFSCSCTVALDTLGERNRGPRAFKPKSQTTTHISAVGNHKAAPGIYNEPYNQPDFHTDYKCAKFFVIKSYSEDNVHKSIKYGVWASTQNGNKKLDAAYHETKEKHKTCPVFLLFSVNASAQFCGVAEMVGPVDFDKSVDYWQQDKWSGQFPVKWHIIKDVPNSFFRHIVLENNDNKPVTNSRDTQEVELEQGIEMLNIFKNYESYSSILDDFYFYEERQKAMQARKSRQQASVVSTPGAEQNPVSLSNDFIKKMSKSFAEAVSLNENEAKLYISRLPQGTAGVKPEKQS